MFMMEAIVIGVVALGIVLFFAIKARSTPKIEEQSSEEVEEAVDAEPTVPKGNVFRSGLQKSRSLLAGSFE